MLNNTKKIIKNAKREVIYKIITSLFIQGLALVLPAFWSNTINEVTEGKYQVGYLLVIITLLLSLFYYLWSYLNQKSWYNFYNKLYNEYTQLTLSRTEKINDINLGEYTNILNNDIDIICNFLGNLVTRIIQGIEFLVIYAYFLSFNFFIFLITIIISIVLIVIYIRFGKEIQSLNIKRKSSLDKKTIMLHKLYSSIINQKKETSSIINLYTKENKQYLKSTLKYNVYIEKIIFTVLSIIESTKYLIIFYSVYLVSIGNIEIGTILLIYSYYEKIILNFEVLGTITADYQSFIVSIKRLNKLIEIPLSNT